MRTQSHNLVNHTIITIADKVKSSKILDNILNDFLPAFCLKSSLTLPPWTKLKICTDLSLLEMEKNTVIDVIKGSI